MLHCWSAQHFISVERSIEGLVYITRGEAHIRAVSGSIRALDSQASRWQVPSAECQKGRTCHTDWANSSPFVPGPPWENGLREIEYFPLGEPMADDSAGSPLRIASTMRISYDLVLYRYLKWSSRPEYSALSQNLGGSKHWQGHQLFQVGRLVLVRGGADPLPILTFSTPSSLLCSAQKIGFNMLLGAIECELPYPTLHEVVVPLGGPPPSRSLQGENARFPQVHFPTGGSWYEGRRVRPACSVTLTTEFESPITEQDGNEPIRAHSAVVFRSGQDVFGQGPCAKHGYLGVWKSSR